jgi:flagellin
MAFAINTNVAALNSYRNLSNTQNDVSKSLEKLSTGLRINRAADDAAGLSISEGLRSQVNGLNVAARNAQDGISVIQTAEGALTEVHSILQRVRDLSVQAANGSNNADALGNIQKEITALGEEVSRIATTTNFNGTDLLTNAAAAADYLSFQVGADAGDVITMSGVDVEAVATAIAGIDVTTGAAAGGGITVADAQIKNVSTGRADLGAIQNRLEHTIKHINISAENLAASESRIRDVDMAKEMASFTKNQIMSQAGTAMLAQANQINQGVLQLLG